MSGGEILYLGEKSQHRLTGWPGDDHYEKTSNHLDHSKTPNKSNIISMKSRYFSIENIQTINSNVTNDGSSAASKNEPESFKQRKDYLLDKLFKSRTLPDPTNETSTHLITKEINLASNSLLAPTTPTTSNNKTVRSSAFQDEYIPLFESKTTAVTNPSSQEEDNDNNTKKVYNPKVNTIEAYQGPYSKKCLMRTRQYMIDLFKPYSTLYSRSNFEDRLFEILKLKMNIKSKFDDDSKLIRKIKRDTAIEKQTIYDRIESQDRRFKPYEKANSNNKPKSSKHSRFDEDYDDVIIEPNTKKSKITLIDLENDKEVEEEEESENDELESNSILKLISNQETFENLDFEEEDDNIVDDDPDSKCIQFGNYLKKSNKDNTKHNKRNKKKKNSTNALLSRHSQKQSEQPKQQEESTTNYRIDRTGLNKKATNNNNNNNELNELESKYKQLRNERNKLLRKKKGIEINAQRQLMSSELKNIRCLMKKMRRKHNHSKFNNK